MGYYINNTSYGKSLSAFNKVEDLISDGAIFITGSKWVPNMVCVVDYGIAQAAAYLYSENEFNEFNNHLDNRPKTFLIHPMAAKLSGYKQ
jgi:hypothetical protein